MLRTFEEVYNAHIAAALPHASEKSARFHSIAFAVGAYAAIQELILEPQRTNVSDAELATALQMWIDQTTTIMNRSHLSPGQIILPPGAVQ
jgi:hypothetical protein